MLAARCFGPRLRCLQLDPFAYCLVGLAIVSAHSYRRRARPCRAQHPVVPLCRISAVIGPLELVEVSPTPALTHRAFVLSSDAIFMAIDLFLASSSRPTRPL